MTGLEAALYGAAGGFAAQALTIMQYRFVAAKKRPKYLKSKFFWVSVLGLILLGAFFAYLWNDQQEITKIVAVQTGITAPLIIERLSRDGPDAGSGTAA